MNSTTLSFLVLIFVEGSTWCRTERERDIARRNELGRNRRRKTEDETNKEKYIERKGTGQICYSTQFEGKRK
jgi:hypothetical protein